MPNAKSGCTDQEHVFSFARPLVSLVGSPCTAHIINKAETHSSLGPLLHDTPLPYTFYCLYPVKQKCRRNEPVYQFFTFQNVIVKQNQINITKAITQWSLQFHFMNLVIVLYGNPLKVVIGSANIIVVLCAVKPGENNGYKILFAFLVEHSIKSHSHTVRDDTFVHELRH